MKKDIKNSFKIILVGTIIVMVISAFLLINSYANNSQKEIVSVEKKEQLEEKEQSKDEVERKKARYELCEGIMLEVDLTKTLSEEAITSNEKGLKKLALKGYIKDGYDIYINDSRAVYTTKGNKDASGFNRSFVARIDINIYEEELTLYIKVIGPNKKIVYNKKNKIKYNIDCKRAFDVCPGVITTSDLNASFYEHNLFHTNDGDKLGICFYAMEEYSIFINNKEVKLEDKVYKYNDNYTKRGIVKLDLYVKNNVLPIKIVVKDKEQNEIYNQKYRLKLAFDKDAGYKLCHGFITTTNLDDIDSDKDVYETLDNRYLVLRGYYMEGYNVSIEGDTYECSYASEGAYLYDSRYKNSYKCLIKIPDDRSNRVAIKITVTNKNGKVVLSKDYKIKVNTYINK